MARDIQGGLANTLIEGKQYFIANFQVFENGGQYKACDHLFRLLLSPTTHVHEENYDIPPHPYSFMPIVEVLKSREIGFAEHLIGIYPFFFKFTYHFQLH